MVAAPFRLAPHVCGLVSAMGHSSNMIGNYLMEQLVALPFVRLKLQTLVQFLPAEPFRISTAVARNYFVMHQKTRYIPVKLEEVSTRSERIPVQRIRRTTYHSSTDAIAALSAANKVKIGPMLKCLGLAHY